MGLTATDAGSFRDPAGQVYCVNDRVYRTVMPRAVEDFEFVRGTGLVDRLVATGALISEKVVPADAIGAAAAGASRVLEHPRLPFISYPYEWPFAALKAAALHHLDVHLTALEHGVTLSDATAYNIQFHGAQPVFIDSLSFRRYREGEFWLAHRQFCEQFLNPLLLRAMAGIPHNAWYRGNLEGISAESLARVLPRHRKLSLNVLTHVVLQARFQAGHGSRRRARRTVADRRLPLAAFKQMLSGLRRWISRLDPADRGETVWQGYAGNNSYASREAEQKAAFVGDFARALEGGVLWDIGCNTGDYASAALEAGVGTVVGFDADQGALDLAFSRARAEKLNFLPLYMDAANPPPSQGWYERERPGLEKRANADGLLALALVHHLAIGRNIPLPDVVRWLVEMAPRGVIEFVQKSDPMVQRLLELREDIFDDYSEASFLHAMGQHARIVRNEAVSSHGRRLFWYERL